MEHSIGTIYKGILEHLLNFKCASGGRTAVCNHHLGFSFGKGSFSRGSLGGGGVHSRTHFDLRRYME